MDPEDNVMFEKNDLSCQSFVAFMDMRNLGEFCDLTIKVQDQSFMAHRVILAAAIPYFRSVLASGSGSESQEQEIAVDDLDSKALELLMNFAYSGKVNISKENVRSLLVASKFLQLHEVYCACTEFLSRRVNIDNVQEVHSLALSLDNTYLIRSYHDFVRNNFEEFSQLNYFLSLPYSHVKEIFSDDDLSLADEDVVFDAVIRWVKACPLEREPVLYELLSEVRMIYIPIDLLKSISREELIRTSAPCRDLLEEVKNYHLWPQEKSMFPNLKCVPRKGFIGQGIRFYAVTWCDSAEKISVFYRESVKKWEELSSQERTESICHVVLVNEEIYMFGPQQMDIFDVKTLEWKTVTYQYPELRGMKSAAVVPHGNTIYLFGSCEDKYVFQVCYFKTDSKKWTKMQTRMNAGRCNSAAASMADSIYLTGGCYGLDSYDNPHNITEKYTPGTLWTSISPVLHARHSHGSTTLSERLYICGGVGKCGVPVKTAEVYDPLSNQWSSISPMVKARQSFTIVSHDAQMYVFGGKQLTEDEDNSVLYYDSECDQWKNNFRVPKGIIGATVMSVSTN